MKSSIVKICGLQDLPTIDQLLQLPVDYIGFVFAESRRRVTARQCAAWVTHIREQRTNSGHLTVGVFVDPTKAELAEILRTVPLDVIQLHGKESPEFCLDVKASFGVKVFKVFAISDLAGENDHLRRRMPNEYVGAMDAMMLDTYDPTIGGGTGKTFNWQVLPEHMEWAENNRIPLLVAGGLHADNVAGLLQQFHPSGVDVSSGVETNGVKDIDKIKAFVERVKQDV